MIHIKMEKKAKSQLSFGDFLKTYTAVSEDFINGYFAFHELCESDPFGINLNDVMEYLKIKDTKSFISNFVENYEAKLNYVEAKQKTKGSKSKEYLVSFDTFQKLCMSSQTEQAKNVREYFVILSNFIEFYKKDFAEAIIDNAQYKEVIYIILSEKTKGLFEMGNDKKEIKKKLRDHMSGKSIHPDIKFMMAVDDGMQIESCVRSLLNEYKNKENLKLFLVDTDTIKYAIFNCAMMKQKIDSIFDKISELDEDEYDIYILFDDGLVDPDQSDDEPKDKSKGRSRKDKSKNKPTKSRSKSRPKSKQSKKPSESKSKEQPKSRSKSKPTKKSPKNESEEQPKSELTEEQPKIKSAIKQPKSKSTKKSPKNESEEQPKSESTEEQPKIKSAIKQPKSKSTKKSQENELEEQPKSRSKSKSTNKPPKNESEEPPKSKPRNKSQKKTSKNE